MAKERSCIFCGQKYEYCPHCNNNSEPAWKFNFDSEKCYSLYNVVAGYNMGVKTVDEVKEVLDKYEVTDYSIFSQKLQDRLNEIVPQKTAEVKEDEVVKPTYNNKFKKNFNKKYEAEKKAENIEE